jgi:hypothetical protein
VETASVDLIEEVSLLHSPPPVAPLNIEPAGPYRSRAPPALA